MGTKCITRHLALSLFWLALRSGTSGGGDSSLAAKISVQYFNYESG